MHSYLNRIYLPNFLLLAVAGFAQAQKNIVISDSLAAHAEELKVKMGTQMVGKTWKIRLVIMVLFPVKRDGQPQLQKVIFSILKQK